MDYTTQSRLKVFGRVTIHEDEPEAPVLIRQLRTPGENAPAERALIVHVEAWDWNCPQHITPRYTQEELVPILAPLRERLQQLEAQVEAGRSRVSPPPG